MDVDNERDVLRRKALGWAARCEEIFPGIDLGRDIRLESGARGLDLARVEGLDALAQALAIALTTRLGDDVFNMRFGFDGLNAMADEANPILVRERIRVAVIQVLRKEPRVRRIVDVNLSGDGRLEPPPAGSRSLDVRVVFETISGEQSSLTLGKMTPNG
jgi:phage baseplate assembly protein W